MNDTNLVQAGPSPAALVWRFEDAPPELRNLSTNGGGRLNKTGCCMERTASSAAVITTRNQSTIR